MFLKSKRFQESAPQAPPVGLYDVKNRKQGLAPGFGKGKRFAELKDSGPGLGNNVSLLDVSACSTSSRNDSKCSGFQFATPLPFRKTRNISSSTPDMKGSTCMSNVNSDLENEVSRLLAERKELENRLHLTQHELRDMEDKFQSLLQEKVNLESSITDLQTEIQGLKEDNGQLMEKVQINSTTNDKLETLEGELKTVTLLLQEKEGMISSLNFELSCAVENSRADLEMEQERNKALNERISYLERTVSEVTSNRDEVEEANQTLHELVAQLRRENIELRTKLDKTEETLEITRNKLMTTVNKGQNKIDALEEMLSKEMLKSKEFGEKLEYSLKQSADHFSEAQSRIVQLQDANGTLESRNQELQTKLFEIIEKEQSTEEKARCLSVEKFSLESRLQKCESDYEQRLSIANDQVESLQKELQRCEETMTDNLRSLTGKYQDLEESYTCFQSEAEKEKNLILAELEATRQSLHKSQQESDRQQNTCVFFKRQNEQMQEDCDELNEQIQSLKAEVNSMADTMSQHRQDFESAKAEVESTKQEMAKHVEEAELNKASLRKELDLAHNTIIDLQKREETLSQELQLRISNQKQQDEELETIKAEMDRAKCEQKDTERRMRVELDRQIKSLEEKAAKSKEEFGRRLVETQKKLSQTEINLEKFRSEHELKMKEKDIEMERKLFSAEEEVNRLKCDLSSKTSNEGRLNELKAEIEMWRTKYVELCEKIEPFKDQLDEYEAERNALLCQNSQAKDEVAKLGQQYAKLLGHQNKKQKIHHVVKLKEENNNLKAEITKLRDQAEKQKRAMKKLEEKVDQVSGKRRFNPTEAFSHHKKENMPLSVLSNGNGAVKR